MPQETERMLTALLDASHVMSLEQVPDQVRRHAAEAGLADVELYVADIQEDVLRLLAPHLPDRSGPSETELLIDRTRAGEAFARLLPVPEGAGTPGRWWVPLLDGAERIGVMRVDTADHGDRAPAAAQHLADLVTMLIVTKRAHSDVYARRRRTRPMTVAAEMQWNLMPPRAFANDRVTISAALEPAYEVGGDAFDYALTDDIAHLGIFDAMGHDVAAGLTANLAVAACRNSRRQGDGLLETAEAIEHTLIEQLGPSRYVTALLAELDLRSGELSWLAQGHHAPVIVRGGGWTDPLPCEPGAPLGMDLGVKATLCHEQLSPGDRLVLYTDGITEAHRPGGEEFGLDRFMNFILHHNAEGLPVPETLRRLVHSIMDYHRGRLQDDATVLFLEWHGPDRAPDSTVLPLADLLRDQR